MALLSDAIYFRQDTFNFVRLVKPSHPLLPSLPQPPVRGNIFILRTSRKTNHVCFMNCQSFTNLLLLEVAPPVWGYVQKQSVYIFGLWDYTRTAKRDFTKSVITGLDRLLSLYQITGCVKVFQDVNSTSCLYDTSLPLPLFL